MSIQPVNHNLIDVLVTAMQHLAWRHNSEGLFDLRWLRDEPDENGLDVHVVKHVNAYDDHAMTAEGIVLICTVYDSLRARYEDLAGKTDAEIALQWGYDAEPYKYWLGKVPGTAMNLHPRALGVAYMALKHYMANAYQAPNFWHSRAHSICEHLKTWLLWELVHPLDRTATADYEWHGAMGGKLVDGQALINEMAELSARLRMIGQPIVDMAEAASAGE